MQLKCENYTESKVSIIMRKRAQTYANDEGPDQPALSGLVRNNSIFNRNMVTKGYVSKRYRWVTKQLKLGFTSQETKGEYVPRH